MFTSPGSELKKAAKVSNHSSRHRQQISRGLVFTWNVPFFFFFTWILRKVRNVKECCGFTSPHEKRERALRHFSFIIYVSYRTFFNRKESAASLQSLRLRTWSIRERIDILPQGRWASGRQLCSLEKYISVISIQQMCWQVFDYQRSAFRSYGVLDSSACCRLSWCNDRWFNITSCFWPPCEPFNATL